eukprot:gb/GECG01010210.1/.p1 GENE.gb/GECG01010210.1/~~gb/GECG01010210.1/.p1  ORF type:complete len:137 (+),score=8.86 gb/GECG01010210.1/:1-411(+)
MLGVIVAVSEAEAELVGECVIFGVIVSVIVADGLMDILGEAVGECVLSDVRDADGEDVTVLSVGVGEEAVAASRPLGFISVITNIIITVLIATLPPPKHRNGSIALRPTKVRLEAFQAPLACGAVVEAPFSTNVSS